MVPPMAVRLGRTWLLRWVVWIAEITGLMIWPSKVNSQTGSQMIPSVECSMVIVALGSVPFEVVSAYTFTVGVWLAGAGATPEIPSSGPVVVACWIDPILVRVVMVVAWSDAGCVADGAVD